LAWEKELTWREEALAAQEENAKISRRALVKVSANLDAKRAKAETTQEQYVDKMEAHTTHARHSVSLDKMEAHTTHAKHSLSLDKMLGEKKVHLDRREWDHDRCEVVLEET
jgi:hypothetical protein